MNANEGRCGLSGSGTVTLVDYDEQESEEQEPIVVKTGYWLAVMPYWDVWHFELLLLFCRRVLHLPTIAAVGDGKEIFSGFRNAGRGSSRPHRRAGR